MALEEQVRIGYSYWGYLGDNKLDANGNEVSTPDGNATYSWALIWEMQRRGHHVVLMQDDRDWAGWKRFGKENFASFSQEKRCSVYEKVTHTFGSSEIFPELDVLLLEWRFPISGRNCRFWEDCPSFPEPWDESLQPDLKRQYELLRHYKQRNTKVIVWDLDHKLTLKEELAFKPDAVFETSQSPLELSMKRVRVEPPTVIGDLLQHPTLPSDPNRKLVYIGSRYERDDVITEWVKPTSDAFPGQVEFHGNWLKTVDECRQLWPNVSYHDRCTTKDFRRIYGTAGAVPLLAKKSYLETGFITPRPWEALLFGSLPVGLGSMKGIEEYTLDGLIANDGFDMVEIAEMLAGMDVSETDRLRKMNVEKLEFMDAKCFVDKVEDVLSKGSNDGTA